MKQFDVINYVTYHWKTCGDLLLATLQFETKLQKCIRKGIIIFNILIWGGISPDICAEITFYGYVAVIPIFDRITRGYTSLNDNLNMVIL